MPKVLINFFEKYSLPQQLVFALILGAIFRFIAAFYSYSPIVLDDYLHALLPAKKLIFGYPLDLPTYRNVYLPYLLVFFVSIGKLFGMSLELINIIRIMTLGLGAISLLTILGCYIYVRREQDRTFSALALYMCSLYALMPFLGVRALAECLAIPFLIIGIGLLRNEKYISGFLFIGISTLIRTQVGCIYLGLILYYLFKRNWQQIKIALIVGVFLVLVEAIKDLLCGRKIFETLFSYLIINKNNPEKNPWYIFIALVLAISYFPLSIVFMDKIKKVFSSHKELSISMLVFIFFHSLSPHKEDRFIAPILPLILIFLSALWAEKKTVTICKKLFSIPFLIINTILLFIINTTNSQYSLIEPLLITNSMAKENHNIKLYDIEYDHWAYGFFLADTIPRETLKRSIKKNDIENLIKGFNRAVFVSFNRKHIEEIENYASSKVKCGAIQTHSNYIDRIIYSLNPKINPRRKPAFSLNCTTNS